MKTQAVAARHNNSPKVETFDFPTLVCRKISTKEDEENGFTIYTGQADITSFLDLPDWENVRRYLLDSGERPKRSAVHVAIEDSLRNRSTNFAVLNGGICIVATEAVFKEDQKMITLINPSIINGSQTRGVIRDYLNANDGEDVTAKAKFELIVTKDSDLADEISIARNFQITVKLISILGKRKYFQEIQDNFKDFSGKNRELRISETDRDPEFHVRTEKLIQVITALIPKSLWLAADKTGEHWNKAFAYNSTAGPLKLFEQIYDRAKPEEKNVAPESGAVELYNFYVDIASEAWQLYETWQSHSGFKGSKLKKGITRDKKSGDIVNIVDGIIFPIIASFASFIKKVDGKWTIERPELWNDNNIIIPAKTHFTSTASSNPNTMGRHKGIYQALNDLTEIVARMSEGK